MEFLVLGLVLALGLVLGQVWGKVLARESEKAYWLALVQDLERELALEKAKAKVRQLVQE
jgi:hypothetical protein